MPLGGAVTDTCAIVEATMSVSALAAYLCFARIAPPSNGACRAGQASRSRGALPSHLRHVRTTAIVEEPHDAAASKKAMLVPSVSTGNAQETKEKSCCST